jgi:hypothetical protein
LARVIVLNGKVKVSLSNRERFLLGRPDFTLDMERISLVQVKENPNFEDLGPRVTKKPLFGARTGEYRNGAKKALVLGRGSKKPFLKISLIHPTIDEIWYIGADAASIAEDLQKKPKRG